MSDWNLIAKYLTGEVTENEKVEVERWLDAHPSNREALDQLKKAVRPGKEHFPDFAKSMAHDWNTIVDKTSASASPPFNFRVFLRVAAVFIITLVAGVALWEFSATSNESYTALDSVMQVTLSDGSDVWLNKNASLTLSPEFGSDERKVILKGEAFFDIVKDNQRPFIIQTNEVITRVKGTALNIKMDSAEISVTVTEGKVSVGHLTQIIDLQIGESALFSTSGQILQKEKNHNVNFLSWKTGIIRFNAATLAEVCVFLSDYYDTKIRPAESIKNKRITTVFDRLSLNQAIQVIAITHDLTVREEGAMIVLGP